MALENGHHDTCIVLLQYIHRGYRVVGTSQRHLLSPPPALHMSDCPTLYSFWKIAGYLCSQSLGSHSYTNASTGMRNSDVLGKTADGDSNTRPSVVVVIGKDGKKKIVTLR